MFGRLGRPSRADCGRPSTGVARNCRHARRQPFGTVGAVSVGPDTVRESTSPATPRSAYDDHPPTGKHRHVHRRFDHRLPTTGERGRSRVRLPAAHRGRVGTPAPGPPPDLAEHRDQGPQGEGRGAPLADGRTRRTPGPGVDPRRGQRHGPAHDGSGGPRHPRGGVRSRIRPSARAPCRGGHRADPHRAVPPADPRRHRGRCRAHRRGGAEAMAHRPGPEDPGRARPRTRVRRASDRRRRRVRRARCGDRAGALGRGQWSGRGGLRPGDQHRAHRQHGHRDQAVQYPPGPGTGEHARQQAGTEAQGEEPAQAGQGRARAEGPA
ncbi:hypothetical protein EDD98_5810 [Streptomyces sp. PanSC19]|nr:hypothetical protein EDD98_5810 [Streptomyces sp. PanSC19]